MSVNIRPFTGLGSNEVRIGSTSNFLVSGEASLEEGELSEEELEQKRKALLRELQENS